MARNGGGAGATRTGLKALIVTTAVTAAVTAAVGVVVTKDLFAGVVDRAGGGPHLTYTVERHFPTTAVDDAWALRDEITDARADALPMAGPEFHEWVLAHGGVQVGTHVTRIQLTNPRAGQVRVTGVRGRVLSSEPAWDGSLFCPYSQGTGEITVVEINLGDQDPVARVPDRQGTGTPYFLANGDITLGKGETHSLVVTALPPTGAWALWTIEVAYTVGGEPATLTINDDGTPFMVADYADRYRAYLVRAGKQTIVHPWRKGDGWYERHPGGCA